MNFYDQVPTHIYIFDVESLERINQIQSLHSHLGTCKRNKNNILGNHFNRKMTFRDVTMFLYEILQKN